MKRKQNKRLQPIVISEVDDSLSDDEATEDLINLSKKPKVLESCINLDDQWIDKYSPKYSSQICINPRKLKELRDLLKDMIEGNSPIRLCILAGPSGSSKSTSVKVLANELLNDFNSINSETKNSFSFDKKNEHERWIEYLDSSLEGVNQTEHFKEFLLDSKFKSDTIILIEDLPNIFNKDTLEEFRKSIKEWIFADPSIKLPPLVLCISEIQILNESSRNEYFNLDNNLTVDTLLGKNIVNQSSVKVINVNSIAKTFLKKTINKIIANERRVFAEIPKQETESFLDNLIEIGDIRSVIANLQVWSTLAKKNFDLSKTFMRETKINLFHAIGKIIFSSSKFKDLDDLQKQDYLSTESVLDNFAANNSSLLCLSLLENYQIYNNMQYDIEIAGDIANNLSIGDLTRNLDEGIDISVKSTRIKLRETQQMTSKQPRLKFPRHFKMIKQLNKSKNEIKRYQMFVSQNRNSFDNLNLIDGYFLPLIYNSHKFKRLHNSNNKITYNRLGGSFKEVYADENPVYEEEMTNEIDTDFNTDQFKLDILERINNLQQNYEYETDDSNELSDPIELSEYDSDEDVFNDSTDVELNQLLCRNQSKNIKNHITPVNTTKKYTSVSIPNDLDDNDELSSDPELEMLISQGKL